MQLLNDDYSAGIFDAQEPPCLSLYQPTHREHPENKQDPIRFRNLVRKLEKSLERDLAAENIKTLLKPFWKLADDFDFWNHSGDGLAVLGGSGLFKVYQLQRTVPELAIAADSFHLKPLLRILQSADRYYVLGLGKQEVKLFVGNRDELDQVELVAEAAQAITAAREKDQDKPRAEAWTFTAGSTEARRGHNVGENLATRQKERFFRAVDRAILTHYSQPSGLPLMLVALPEHHASFYRISHNPMLISDGIETNPDALSLKELRKQAWRVMEPHYLARLAGLVEMFEVARSRELGTGDLSEAMRAAVGGRVVTLLVEAARQIPGRVDLSTGAIEFSDMADPMVDDLLDDLGTLVLRNGGQVVVVPTERMPTKTGLAATYRF